MITNYNNLWEYAQIPGMRILLFFKRNTKLLNREQWRKKLLYLCQLKLWMKWWRRYVRMIVHNTSRTVKKRRKDSFLLCTYKSVCICHLSYIWAFLWPHSFPAFLLYGRLFNWLTECRDNLILSYVGGHFESM